MLGNFASVYPSNMPIKIAAIHNKKVAYHATTNRLTWVRMDLLRPIPLTSEILEKNGWSRDIYDNESYDNEDAEMLSLWVGEDGRNAWWWHAGFELVIPINYVHQLQNALTLCGIEKEIEL
jgi:hypothetical protein